MDFANVAATIIGKHAVASTKTYSSVSLGVEMYLQDD